MKKYIIVGLLLIFLSACGPVRRTVKTESTSRSRDSIRIEQVRSDFTNSVKLLSDNSRIRIVYYRLDRDSVTGEQLIEREEIRENNIVSKASILKMENDTINVFAFSKLEEKVLEEKQEKRGLNGIQRVFLYIGLGLLSGSIIYLLKRFGII